MDGSEDTDANGAVDDTETDPNDADTDDGSVPDGVEVERGTDPLNRVNDILDPLLDEREPFQYVAGGCDCNSAPVWPLSGLPLVAALLVLVRRRRVA